MTLPAYAVARLSRLTYVRFALDHHHFTACALNAGPLEAAHSSMNGEWVLAQIEPFADVHRFGEIPGLMLRLMGAPFRGTVVYAIADQVAPDSHERELCRKPVRCGKASSSNKATSAAGRSARSRTSSE